VIEIKPHRNGWKVFEADGVEPVFLKREQAVSESSNCIRISPTENSHGFAHD
jgi:hypothetical protein